jgi:hypothetical protein
VFTCVGEGLAWEASQEKIKVREISDSSEVTLGFVAEIELICFACMRVYFARKHALCFETKGMASSFESQPCASYSGK